MLTWLLTKAYAQSTIVPPDGTVEGCDFAQGNMTWDCFPNYIQYLARLTVGFTLTICLIMILINGYRYMLGPVFGEGSNEAAKKGIINALLGSAVALLAYLIIDITIVILSS